MRNVREVQLFAQQNSARPSANDFGARRSNHDPFGNLAARPLTERGTSTFEWSSRDITTHKKDRFANARVLDERRKWLEEFKEWTIGERAQQPIYCLVIVPPLGA